MNINTLAQQVSDRKSGDLPVALYPNKMRQQVDGRLTYFARVINRGVCTNSDIANDIVASGLNGELIREQLLRAAELFTNARLSRIADSYTVDDGICRTYVKVTGSFASEADAFSTERHGIGLRSYATAEAKEALSELRPVIRQGNSTRPVITKIRDLESGKDDTLTRGGFLDIRGANLCIGGDAEDVGLYFEHTEDSGKAIRLSAQKLGTNTATRIVCVVPLGLRRAATGYGLSRGSANQKSCEMRCRSCMTGHSPSHSDCAQKSPPHCNRQLLLFQWSISPIAIGGFSPCNAAFCRLQSAIFLSAMTELMLDKRITYFHLKFLVET